MAFNPRDHYFKRAKKENFAARSAFKLEEIDQKFKIFKSQMRVLDLGASPGSWSQYAAQKVGPQGAILGIDLKPVTVKLAQAKFIQADLYALDLPQILVSEGFTEPFDVVMSDMAPQTTGIRSTDQARSTDLCHLALATSQKFLKKGGVFICKLFHSDDFSVLRDAIKQDFVKFEALRPDSTRKISKEIFLMGFSKKSEPSWRQE